jgi:glycosyltransferase involved in cell wall biosynthesis
MWKKERHSLGQVLQRVESEIIHVNWTYEYALAAIDTGLPHLITAHDVPSRLVRLMKPRWYWWPRLFMGWRNGIKANRLTTVSPYSVNAWRDEMRRKGPIDMIPNPVSKYSLNLGSLRKPQVKRQGFRNQAPVFASIANGFAGRKNTHTLLRAFSRVRKVHSEARLIMFGTGHGRGDEGGLWAIRNDLALGVDFRGWTKQEEMLTDLHNEADVLVHPALEESFGQTIIEAQALGIPVVGGRSSGAVPWLLDGGLAGTLCDVSSPEHMSVAMIESLCSHDQNRIDYSRDRLQRVFSPELVAGAYLKAIEATLSRT